MPLPPPFQWSSWNGVRRRGRFASTFPIGGKRFWPPPLSYTPRACRHLLTWEVSPHLNSTRYRRFPRTRRYSVRYGQLRERHPRPLLMGAFLVPDHSAVDKTTLVKEMRDHASHVGRSGKLVLRAARKLHMPRTFGKLGPDQRIKMLRAAALTPSVLGRFVFDATSANIPKQVKGPLPSMASAFRCYASFCELRKVPCLPVLGETVPQ